MTDPVSTCPNQTALDVALIASSKEAIERSRELLIETRPLLNPYSAEHCTVNSVSITEVCGEWHVLVQEDGKESARTFVTEQYALNYAEGQRLRLHFNKVMRI
ncbi:MULTISPECIES: hypothetical protein [unclassified Mesorhizobium]|uniref:hypothetical protein n=1 Tax=unclassified Mesorhizobium TaxID=325217 RepID=UPI000FCBAD92|nr:MULTISPECIES: hypothetical protein [unclassified Mesorhizobium]RUX33435.1 hypothetical protein EOA23_06625 [Mesorhizobium sp. M2A.F.Ca.ET.042.01.1.1]RWB73937.1 MAG: hypothetical protein EOQ50_15725 [Mesorhizobium sp.]RWD73291.1 MAG: hypothetical protein EOS37_06145 [Mesorhizobium sp.]RWE77947.1 MAG: hypothetical protein EOS42_06510 [Mesorhizobium sp.]TIV31566.1 MAG: hypothetical protein E5V90_06730 [Mesorhizobium sp.]